MSMIVESGVSLETARTVFRYYSLILIIVGCVCNPLSLIVFSRRKFRSSTMSIYLRMLSVYDMGAILSTVARNFILESKGTGVIMMDLIPCKVSWYFGYLFVYLSAWTLVSVTAERVVSVIWPHRVRVWCSRSMAVVIQCITVLIFAGISVPYTLVFGTIDIGVGSQNATVTLRCVTLFAGKVEALLSLSFDSINFALLPCFLLVTFNIIIINGVINSRKKLLKLKTRSNNTQTHQFSNFEEADTVDSEKHSTNCQSVGMVRNPTVTPRRSRKEISLMITLVAINSSYILCNIPWCVWTFGPHFQSAEGMGPIGVAITDLLAVLMYTNNCLNFFLYYATGSRFRSEFKAMCLEIFGGNRK